MRPNATVKENYLFRRIYRKGRSAVRPALVVYCLPNKRSAPRLGVTVSTKLGKAVVRNRVRRRFREMFRAHRAEMAPSWDVILVGRSRAVHIPFQALEKQYLSALAELGLLEKQP